jgi:hypothetical protein
MVAVGLRDSLPDSGTIAAPCDAAGFHLRAADVRIRAGQRNISMQSMMCDA